MYRCTFTNVLCHNYKWFVPHTWMRHVTNWNESFLYSTSLSLKWVLNSHILLRLQPLKHTYSRLLSHTNTPFLSVSHAPVISHLLSLSHTDTHSLTNLHTHYTSYNLLHCKFWGKQQKHRGWSRRQWSRQIQVKSTRRACGVKGLKLEMKLKINSPMQTVKLEINSPMKILPFPDSPFPQIHPHPRKYPGPGNTEFRAFQDGLWWGFDYSW